MAGEDQSKELNFIIDKGAVNIVQDYFQLLDKIDAFMSLTKLNVQQVSEAAGISEWQLYRRKNKPELWTKDELVKLFSHPDVKIERSPAIATSTEEKVSTETSTPILGPRADGKTVSEFRSEKLLLVDNGYPVAKTLNLIAQYFDPIRDEITRTIDKNTLLITVPSGSGENKIPILFSKHLAKTTGAEVLPEGMISKLHKGEAKLSLSLEKRVHDPIRYELRNIDALKKITSAYQKIVIVDDLLNSGESSIRLRKTLAQADIKVHAFVNLVNVEKRYPSPADLDRLYKKIAELAKLILSDRIKLKRDLPLVFQDYTRQKLNHTERAVRDQKSALAAFKSISKAASLEDKLKKSADQNLSI
jgi:hypothetical protein